MGFKTKPQLGQAMLERAWPRGPVWVGERRERLRRRPAPAYVAGSGLAVGSQAASRATAAILNAVLLPLAVLSGLWMPLEILPEFVQGMAYWLPTYHLAQLGLAQLTGAATVDAAGHALVLAGHALVLAGWTVVTATAAAVSYRHARP